MLPCFRCGKLISMLPLKKKAAPGERNSLLITNELSAENYVPAE